MQNINDRVHAMSACRLMDTFISSPDWNRTIFTDSVQLFSDVILLDAQATAAARQQPPAQESRTDQQFLEDLFLELQESLKSTQKELSAILAQVHRELTRCILFNISILL
jgi:hypothetical protein